MKHWTNSTSDINHFRAENFSIFNVNKSEKLFSNTYDWFRWSGSHFMTFDTKKLLKAHTPKFTYIGTHVVNEQCALFLYKLPGHLYLFVCLLLLLLFFLFFFLFFFVCFVKICFLIMSMWDSTLKWCIKRNLKKIISCDKIGQKSISFKNLILGTLV